MKPEHDHNLVSCIPSIDKVVPVWHSSYKEDQFNKGGIEGEQHIVQLLQKKADWIHPPLW